MRSSGKSAPREMGTKANKSIEWIAGLPENQNYLGDVSVKKFYDEVLIVGGGVLSFAWMFVWLADPKRSMTVLLSVTKAIISCMDHLLILF